ncbi:LysM peptidoglycan-binding domain-containing protein [Geothrix sp. SG200]|uniref:LysM peptidoglycan-binding domain-containing protein n=1 Tax=Geothrix sp. SG200 TaxID=2922865 RepID=UPI001FAE58EA|nr:LysM peptidoglycan-binding domain-containing protein [Geothrix sp. SG200]
MDRFDLLKSAYSQALSIVNGPGFQVHNLHLQDDKLFLKASAGSDQLKNAVWDALKTVNPSVDDVTCDIDVNPALAPKEAAYEVHSGDSLSKIAKRFYGDANAYLRIFEANRDQLSDPDKIQVGQTLRIPLD